MRTKKMKQEKKLQFEISGPLASNASVKLYRWEP